MSALFRNVNFMYTNWHLLSTSYISTQETWNVDYESSRVLMDMAVMYALMRLLLINGANINQEDVLLKP